MQIHGRFFSLPFFGLGLKCKYQKQKKKVFIFLIHSTLKEKKENSGVVKWGSFPPSHL